ncbi:unnamed protein product [Ectocarpus sp. 4 AP-2014]
MSGHSRTPVHLCTRTRAPRKKQPSTRRCPPYSTWQTGGLKLKHAHQLESDR